MSTSGSNIDIIHISGTGWTTHKSTLVPSIGIGTSVERPIPPTWVGSQILGKDPSSGDLLHVNPFKTTYFDPEELQKKLEELELLKKEVERLRNLFELYINPRE